MIKNTFHLEDLVVTERVKIVESRFVAEVHAFPSYDELRALLGLVPERDTLKLDFTTDSDDVLSISSKSDCTIADYTAFLDCVTDETTVNGSISIEKKVKDNFFSIYDFSAFSSDLKQLSISQVLSAFSLLLKGNEYLFFDLFEQNVFFTTNTMAFVSSEKSVSRREIFRSKRLQSCRETSYFLNSNEYALLPDDFDININFEGNPLSELFDKISMLLSLIYISTTSSLHDNDLKIQINGQRNIEATINISELKTNKEFLKIYQWIYTDGNAVDKAIIAHNIISLHCRYIGLFDMDEKTFASIQSNYKLYLKNNVNQYLELKNKLAEFIIEVVSKTGDFATIIWGNFKTNLLALLGFMLTVVLANIVSDQPLQNIFNKDITALIELILVGSIIYLIICLSEAIYKLKKTKNSYYALKKNYDSVLSDIELQEVFQKDNLFNNTEKTVIRGIIGYTIMWVLFLIISFVVLENISSAPFLSPILSKWGTWLALLFRKP